MPRIMPGRVVVIGAGIVGASCAYELARRGWSVELLDKGTVGGGCSHGNCGYVCPSHVFPLAKPGAIASTLPLILRPNSPFMVRLRPDLSLLSWFSRFARCCDAAVMQDTSVALHALLVAAKARYEEVIREEGINCDYTAKGCLFVYQTAHHMDAFEPVNRSLLDRYGYGARRIDGTELARVEPTLRDGLAGAWVFDCDAHLRPDRYMSGLRAALTRRGVTIRERCEVTGLVREGDRARRVTTTQGDFAADAFVFAAGAWTPLMSGMLGVRLPIVPGKGYSVTARRPTHCPTFPIVFEEHRVAITPFADGYRIGSTMEFAGYDESVCARRIALLRDSAAKYLRHPEPLSDEQPWYGWRPMTPDGKPFIDFAPGTPNVLIAAGHNMIGMSTGPGTGQVAAQMLGGEPTTFDVRPFRIARG